MALSVGATYTFGITTEGGVTHFIAYQDSTQVWSNDAPTGGNYLVLSSSYSGYADYTDYEEIWVTSTSGGSPAFDFYFYDNYWVPTGGGENAATWTSYYSGAPSNVAVIISGNSVLVHNPLATVLFETDPTSFAASPGTITFSGQTYSNGQTAEYADNSYQVTANAPTGYQFDHWEYSGSSGSGVYVANINANTTTVQVNGEGWLKAVFTVGSWGAWTSLGGQLLAGTSPAATNVSDQPYWFVTGTNHQLYYATTGSSSWTSLGGVLTSSPGATSPSAGVIDVFVRGTNGALYTRHYSGGVWGAWTSLGGQIPFGTSPAACSWGASREDVFVQGTNGALYQKTWTGTWSGWTNLGGVLTSSPGATSPSAGVIDVFVRGTNGALYTRHYSGGVWGAWTSLGGQIPAGTSPAACSWSASREDVFVQGTNGALYQKTSTSSGWSSSWTGLGGVLTSSPAATSPASGTIDVFVRGTNGALYERIYTGG